jgi:hypothetical protein
MMPENIRLLNGSFKMGYRRKDRYQVTKRLVKISRETVPFL